MTRARLWAIPTLVGVALLLVLPISPAAGAAAGLTVTISAPGEGQRISASDAVTVSGQVSVAALLTSIDTVTVRIFFGDSEVYAAEACDPCGSDQSVSYSVTSPPLGRNGPFGVEVVANGHILLNGFTADGRATRTFALAVPAGPPGAVKTTVLENRSVRLTWAPPAPVSGLLGYAIYRKVDTDGFKLLGVTKEITFTDASTASLAGAVQYQVASIREGAVPLDPATAIQTPSAAVVATLPPLPTTSTVPGVTTTTLPPGGGAQEGGAATLDIGSLLPAASSTPPLTFPPLSPPPTLPDTGFNPNLPFVTTPASPTTAPGKIEGRQPGRTAAATGQGEVASGSGDDTNRRALLVPVAAGSVLCVTALHLRWLNRRLALSGGFAASGAGASAGAGADGFGPSDLEHLPIDAGTGVSATADSSSFRSSAEPVGVGTGAGSRLR